LSRLLAENLDHNLLPFNFFEKHSFWKFPIKVDNLKIWQEKLLELGIDAAATNLPNLAELDCFKHILKNELKNTPFLTNNILYIPVHYYLTHAEVYKVAEIINYIYNSQDELKKEV
jgi:dTDP-4-amino-4,6-dideoxygalactose transaminase